MAGYNPTSLRLAPVTGTLGHVFDRLLQTLETTGDVYLDLDQTIYVLRSKGADRDWVPGPPAHQASELTTLASNQSGVRLGLTISIGSKSVFSELTAASLEPSRDGIEVRFWFDSVLYDAI